EQRTRSSVCMRSSSGGSKPRPCCRRPILLRCCSGRCSPRGRSTCGKSMVGRRSPQTPSINRLTSLPDSVLSKRRRSRHAKFQHIRRRRLGTVLNAQIKKLELRRQLKELVPPAHVQKHIERIAINIKQVILHIPSRHASQIAVKLGCDAVALEAELTKAITAEMNGICAPVVPPPD